MTVFFYGGPFDSEAVALPEGVALTLRAPDGTWHIYKVKPLGNNGDMSASYVRQAEIAHDRPTP